MDGPTSVGGDVMTNYGASVSGGSTPDDTLAVLQADRARLNAASNSCDVVWTAGSALLTALVVVAPAFGGAMLFTAVAVLSCVGALWIEGEQNRRAGFRPSWPRGRRYWLFAVGMALAYLVVVVASLGLTAAGHAQWSFVLAVVAFLVVFLTSRFLSRVADAERFALAGAMAEPAPDPLLGEDVTLRTAALLRAVGRISEESVSVVLNDRDGTASAIRVLGDSGYLVIGRGRLSDVHVEQAVPLLALTPRGHRAVDAHVAALASSGR